MNFYLLTFNEDWADEHNVPALACMSQKEYDEWAKTRLSFYALLGNGGADFCDELQGKTGQELVDQEFVSKTLVSEDFADVFLMCRLGDLSLCNIFDGDEYEEE
jgi:hypothetical protein